MKRRTIETLLLTSLLALLPACGGGGGGGGGGVVQPPPPGITFTAGGAAGADSVALQAGTTTSTSLELRVVAQAVPGLYGLAFDLDYPSTALHYANSSAGDVLAAGGASVLLQVAETAAGHLVVGISRSGAVPGVASASGVVLTMRFDAAAAGNGPFAFTRNRAFDQAGFELTGVSWVGGSVAVVR